MSSEEKTFWVELSLATVIVSFGPYMVFEFNHQYLGCTLVLTGLFAMLRALRKLKTEERGST